ncbi:MAG: hypothetical protein ACREGR_00600 [Minisyncoccia bacterium]
MSPSNGARTAHFLLRLGAAIAFLYPPLAALGDPVSWESYFPHFIRVLPIDTLYLLHGFGALEAVLALWVLSGWRIRIPAALMTLILAAIVIFDFVDISVLFRDISIACATLALAFWPVAAEQRA